MTLVGPVANGETGTLAKAYPHRDGDEDENTPSRLSAPCGMCPTRDHGARRTRTRSPRSCPCMRRWLQGEAHGARRRGGCFGPRRVTGRSSTLKPRQDEPISTSGPPFEREAHPVCSRLHQCDSERRPSPSLSDESTAGSHRPERSGHVRKGTRGSEGGKAGRGGGTPRTSPPSLANISIALRRILLFLKQSVPEVT